MHIMKRANMAYCRNLAENIYIKRHRQGVAEAAICGHCLALYKQSRRKVEAEIGRSDKFISLDILRDLIDNKDVQRPQGQK